MTPIVRTVLGDIDPGELGVTLTHEHLLIEFGRWQREAAERGELPVPAPRLESDDPRSADPLRLETVGWVRRNWAMHPDNMLLEDEDLAIAEIRAFHEAGGRAIVDATNLDLHRQPEALVRIAQAVGLHIVMGAGHYVADFHPLDMDDRDEERIAGEIAADVTDGCDGTTIRAGVIGEIGCSWPLTENERRSLRASARAQRETGAALLIHPGRDPRSPLEIMSIVREAGGNPQRTIMSHLDRTIFEDAELVELASTGCYLEFDLFGQESAYYPLSPIDMPNDATRVDHLRHLIDAGYGERLLVAHDVCRKTSLAAYGGEGYAHILTNVVPLMERKGFGQSEIDAILVDNPARVLAFEAGE